MLNQLSAEAFNLLKDTPIGANALKVLLRMKPTRQVEAAKLIVSAGNFTRRFAQALYTATKRENRVMPRGTRRMSGLPQKQEIKMQHELECLLNDSQATESYGTDVLSLVVASGYVSKLIGNQAIENYLASHHSEILERFKAIVSAVSLDTPPIEAPVDHPKRHRGRDRRVSRTQRSPRGAPSCGGDRGGSRRSPGPPILQSDRYTRGCLPGH